MAVLVLAVFASGHQLCGGDIFLPVRLPGRSREGAPRTRQIHWQQAAPLGSSISIVVKRVLDQDGRFRLARGVSAFAAVAFRGRKIRCAVLFYFGAAAAERAYACFAVGAGDKSRQNHCLVYYAGLSGGAGRLLHPQRQPAVAVRNGLSCLADLLLGRASLAKRRKAHGAFGVSAGGARFLRPQCSAARCSAAYAGLGAQPGAVGNSPLRFSACHVVRRASLPVGRKKVLEISGR